MKEGIFMKKALSTLLAVSLSVFMLLSFASAVEINSYSEDLSVYYNGEDVYANSENKPCIINDRTLVPLRPIFEAMGWAEDGIAYDDSIKSATFQSDDTSCTFTNDSSTALITYADGTTEEYTLDVPATIHNGSFHIPIRAFCEIWGTDIEWIHETRSVIITSNPKADTSEPTEEEAPVEAPEETEPQEDEVAVPEIPETEESSTALTDEEAVSLVAETLADGMVASFEYFFEYEGESYYQIEVSTVLVDQVTGEPYTSRATSYIVKTDGSEMFEGYYDLESGTLANYEK